MDNKLWSHLLLSIFDNLIRKANLAFCFLLKNRILFPWYCFFDPAVCAIILLWVQPYKKNCKEDTWKKKDLYFFMLGQLFCWLFWHNVKADETCVWSNTRKYISYRCNNNFIRSTDTASEEVELEKGIQTENTAATEAAPVTPDSSNNQILDKGTKRQGYQSNQHQLWE